MLMRAKSKLSLGLIMLLFTSLSYAGIGESSWHFAKNETVVFDFTNYRNQRGAQFTCGLFSPEAVSFVIEYDYPSIREQPINVIADKADKVHNNKFNKTITVTNATNLTI